MAVKKDVAPIISSKDIFVGNENAAVTLMEFGEYESEVCAKANEVVKQLLQAFEGKIRFNFRHFPLTKVHQRSMKAGEAAMAAAQCGKFWEMHNILFEKRLSLGTTSLKIYSKEVGVENKHFLDELVNSTYGQEVRNDLLEGLEKGVRDVPAFFINNVPFTGEVTFENLSKEINAALKKTKSKTTTNSKTVEVSSTEEVI